MKPLDGDSTQDMTTAVLAEINQNLYNRKQTSQ